MTPTQIEYAVKAAFAAVTAVCLYLLQQTEIPLVPVAIVAINIIVITIAAVNPSTVSARYENAGD
jgi:biotin transporter BioY